MATPITTTATTVVGQLFEMLSAVDELQSSPDTNPDGVTVISTFSLNAANGTISFAGCFPVDEEFSAGKLMLTATDSFVDAV